MKNARGRGVRIIIVLVSYFFLVACQGYSGGRGAEVEAVAEAVAEAMVVRLPKYPVVGVFTLDERSPTISVLLERFQARGREAFIARDFESPSLEVNPGWAWCEIYFEHDLVGYIIGVQFLRYPEEGERVLAIVRTMSTVEGWPVDEKFFSLTEDIYIALLVAQGY